MSEIIFLDEYIIENLYKDVVKSSGSNIYGFINENFKSVPTTIENLCFYDDCVDIFTLATKYAFCIIQYHSFVDGNKRTAFAVMIEFLDQNGYEIKNYDTDEMVEKIEKIASKSITFDEFVSYLYSCHQ
jgi:death-on-curing protein